MSRKTSECKQFFVLERIEDPREIHAGIYTREVIEKDARRTCLAYKVCKGCRFHLENVVRHLPG